MEHLPLWLHVAIILLSCGLLAKGADWLVVSASRIAAWLGVPDLVIGLTVVAFGTSAPEFAVTVGAAFEGKGEISLANVVGSNIFNLGVILGLCAMLTRIPVPEKVARRDGPFLLLVAVAITAMASNGVIQRAEGVAMMVVFVSYLLYLFSRKEPLEELEVEHTARWSDFPMLALGLLMVAGGGKLLVDSASALARSMGVSDWVIGLTIVGAGTSLPELVTSLTASLKGKHDISAGNLVGSDLFNILGVLSVAAMVSPLSVGQGVMGSLVLMVFSLGFLLVLLQRSDRLGWGHGVALLTLSVMRWGWDFL